FYPSRCCFVLDHCFCSPRGHDVDEANTLRLAPCPRMAGPCAFMHVRVRYSVGYTNTLPTSHDDGVSSRLVPFRLVSSCHFQIPHQCLLVLLTSKCRTSGTGPFEALGE
ncbi:hypothetical protein CCMA1212_000854, partial [Trichoderma ghanense]